MIRELIESVLYPAAILDLHFYQNRKFFAVVSSTGALSIFRVTKEHELYTIRHVATHQVLSKNILILSLAWYPYQSLTDDSNKKPMISITASNGGVFIIRLSKDFTSYNILNNGAPLIQHSDNTWTSYFSNHFILSGGDDSILSRILFEQDALENQGNVKLTKVLDDTSQINFKGHNAGVTAILVLRIEDTNTILLTGSYDDHIRVFITPNSQLENRKGPKLLAQLDLGGGVWRLKIMQYQILDIEKGASEWTVLASCMHAGARILKVKRNIDQSWSIKILAEMRAHQSMCYASDVQARSDPQNQSDNLCQEQAVTRSWTVLSSSFYDKLLRVWEWNPETAISS